MAQVDKTKLKEKPTKAKKKKKNVSPKVLVRVTATFNNTIVAVCDYEGNVLSIATPGSVGFKGSKKSTAYAATLAGEEASKKAIELGAREAEIIVKGIGIGRQAAVKGIRAAGLKITSLADHTSIPHGGCKPRRKPSK